MSKPQPPKKRPKQQRSRVTVEAILEAAGQVLVSLGPLKATTHKIADRAGVSVGTLYQYFPNKEAVFAELLKQHREQVLNELVHNVMQANPSGIDDVEVLARAAVEALLQPFVAHPAEACALIQHRHALVTSEQRQADQRPLLQALSLQLQQFSGVRTFDDVEVAAFFIVKATEAIAVSAATEMPQKLEDGTVARELTRMLLAYVRPEPTEKTA